MDVTEAAREALAAHDHLRAVQEREPECDPETGLPRNEWAWIEWRSEESKPAYERFGAAMDALARAVDDPDMSRHPFNFRPLCEEILSR